MADLSKLAQGFSGRTVRPTHADYDTPRTVMYGGIAKRPAALARVKNAGDVVRAVSFARENSIPLAIRSGGHSANGYSTVEGGIVIALRDMKGIDLDGAARTVWADA